MTDLITAHVDVIVFEHVEVALFLCGVLDELGPQLGVIRGEAGGSPCDPAGALLDLLSQVVEQAAVVVEAGLAALDPGHRGTRDSWISNRAQTKASSSSSHSEAGEVR